MMSYADSTGAKILCTIISVKWIEGRLNRFLLLMQGSPKPSLSSYPILRKFLDQESIMPYLLTLKKKRRPSNANFYYWKGFYMVNLLSYVPAEESILNLSYQAHK
eukprot:bmy_21582T0